MWTTGKLYQDSYPDRARGRFAAGRRLTETLIYHLGHGEPNRILSP